MHRMRESRRLLKAAAAPLVAYVLCLGAALVALIVTAAAAAHWGAARTERALLLMLGIDAGLFLASALLVFLLLGRWVRLRWRVLIGAGYLVLAVATLFVLALVSAVVFNR